MPSKFSPRAATEGIQDWCRNIRDASSETRSSDTPISPASVYPEDVIEDCVLQMFGNDPSFAQALIHNLKGKREFILPLFVEDEDVNFFESPFVATPPGFVRGLPHTGSSDSAASSGYTGSSVSISDTPATSADHGKDGKPTEAEDKPSKSQQPRSKGRISRNSLASDESQQRRLRCHFYAKCPANHSKERTCVRSGWKSIHHLKYVTSLFTRPFQE